MINIVVSILAGLVLLRGVLQTIPGIGQSLERFAGWLSTFEVVIGVFAIVLGILELLSLEGILLILAGLVLAATAMRTIPSIGPGLGRLAYAMTPYRAAIGAIIMIVGLGDLIIFILGLFGRFR